jgi:hypothetical protein
MVTVRARRHRSLRDEQVTALLLHVIPRQRIRLVAGLALPGAAVVLPVVPRADHVLPIERALGQRAAGMVADAGEGPELAGLMGDHELQLADGGSGERLPVELRGGAEVMPHAEARGKEGAAVNAAYIMGCPESPE